MNNGKEKSNASYLIFWRQEVWLMIDFRQGDVTHIYGQQYQTRM
jgi:hypothetical protein